MDGAKCLGGGGGCCSDAICRFSKVAAAAAHLDLGNRAIASPCRRWQELMGRVETANNVVMITILKINYCCFIYYFTLLFIIFFK